MPEPLSLISGHACSGLLSQFKGLVVTLSTMRMLAARLYRVHPLGLHAFELTNEPLAVLQSLLQIR
jgi:hypothetical protein